MPCWLYDPRELQKPAADLHRDLRLVWEHGNTIRLLLGSRAWFCSQRKWIDRPYTELSPRFYPLEYVRIILQGLLTFPLALLIVIALVLSLATFELYRRTNCALFAQPFGVVKSLLQMLLSQRYFRIPSPNGEPPKIEDRDGPRQEGQAGPPVANRADLVPRRTFIAVPEDSSLPKEVFYYINGIVEQGAMVQGTALLLYTLTGRMCNVFVNPSHGIGIDLLECVLDRTLDICAAPCGDIENIIEKQLSLGRKVVLIAHSQGGIILSSVVKNLLARSQLELENNPNGSPVNSALLDRLTRLEAYSFCSAADLSASLHNLPFSEHFATESDFVARIGVLTFSGRLPSALLQAPRDQDQLANFRKEWNGQVYMLPKSSPCNGHLMKEMVLPALKMGLFGHESVFWKRYCDSRPENVSYKPISHHLVEQD